MNTFKSRVITATVRAVACLSLRQAQILGYFVGCVAYLCQVGSVRVTRRNLLICFPQMSSQQRQKLVFDSVIETARLAAETCVIWSKDSQQVNRFITEFEGEERFKTACQNQQGLLILAPHVGNWEVLGFYLASHAETVNMYQPPKIAGLEKIIRQSRSHSGASSVPTDRKGLITILKALKDGKVSGVLPDQSPKEEQSGVFAPFFNTSAFTMTLAHKLIQKSHCQVLFAMAERIKGGYRIIFRVPPEGIFNDDPLIAATALNKGVEDIASISPAQYQWEYKRFKKRPAGEKPLY